MKRRINTEVLYDPEIRIEIHESFDRSKRGSEGGRDKEYEEFGKNSRTRRLTY